MCFRTYIKSLNETFLMVIVIVVIFIPLTAWWIFTQQGIPNIENISKLAKNNLEMKNGYSVFLVSDDENVRMSHKDDYYCGYDTQHPIYEGNYKIVSVKGKKVISSYDLSFFGQPLFFTDNKPHNGIDKFIEPKTEEELIIIYQYASCNNEYALFFRLDDKGIIKPTNFYSNLVQEYSPDYTQNEPPHLITNYNGLISSLSDTNGKKHIGVCFYANLYGHIGTETYCETFEYKDGDFYRIEPTQKDEIVLCSQNRWEELQTEKPVADFEDYPVEDLFFGPIVPIDEKSSFAATRYKSRIQWAVDDGVNFAGHYTIASWGATGIGMMFVVIDLTTGKVFPFPYIAQVEFDYRKDSNLLIVDSLPLIKSILGEDPSFLCNLRDPEIIRPYYFVWENSAFRFLGPKDNSPPNDNDFGWMHQ